MSSSLAFTHPQDGETGAQSPSFFSFERVRGFAGALGWYAALWLGGAAASIALTAPAVLRFGAIWGGQDADLMMKFSVVGTHAVCALLALIASTCAIRAKALTRNAGAWVATIVVAIAAGMIGSPAIPIVAAALSTRNIDQHSISITEGALLAVIAALIGAVIFVTTPRA
jgi:hypothetical protein